MCWAQGNAWVGDTCVSYMSALVDSCATVKDPLLSIINVSLACAPRLTEARPPSLPCPAQARLGYIVLLPLSPTKLDS